MHHCKSAFANVSAHQAKHLPHLKPHPFPSPSRVSGTAGRNILRLPTASKFSRWFTAPAGRPSILSVCRQVCLWPGHSALRAEMPLLVCLVFSWPACRSLSSSEVEGRVCRRILMDSLTPKRAFPPVIRDGGMLLDSGSRSSPATGLLLTYTSKEAHHI